MAFALQLKLTKMLKCFSVLIFISQILSYSFAQAQGSCFGKLGGKDLSSPKLRSKYTIAEIRTFVLKKEILPPHLLEQATQEVLLFRLGDEDMGNALFLAVLEKLGNRPSPRKDMYIEEFLSPIFELYLSQFKIFTEAQAPGPITRVPNFYGLKKYGYKPDSYGMLLWNKAMSADLLSKIEPIIRRKISINLNEVNQVLVQMGFLHSILSRQNKMTFAELKMASDEFEMSVAMDHAFVPTIGEWDISNINAEWYFNVTVNMFPPRFDQKIDVHGGLSTIEGLTHDHGHFYNLRLKALVTVLHLHEKLNTPNDRMKVLYLDNLLRTLLQEALKIHHRQGIQSINPETLANTVFFFIHQPEPLQIFLTSLRNGENNWGANSSAVKSLAHEMRLQLEKHTEFYPNLGKRFDEFELTASYLIQLLGPTSKPIQNFLQSN